MSSVQRDGGKRIGNQVVQRHIRQKQTGTRLRLDQQERKDKSHGNPTRWDYLADH